jgi:hypothetical protein
MAKQAWSLTDGQLRELARWYCIALTRAGIWKPLEADAWLNARLRERGCPERELAAWRHRIKALALTNQRAS